MTEYACPKCGNTHIVSHREDYATYFPMCLKCGYVGSIGEFIVASKKGRTKTYCVEEKE